MEQYYIKKLEIITFKELPNKTIESTLLATPQPCFRNGRWNLVHIHEALNIFARTAVQKLSHTYSEFRLTDIHWETSEENWGEQTIEIILIPLSSKSQEKDFYTMKISKRTWRGTMTVACW